MNGEKADMVFTDPPYGINESASKRSTRETNSIAKSNSHLKEFKDDSTSYAVDAFNHCQAMGIPIQIWFGANYYCHSIPETNNWLVWDKRLDDKQSDNNSDAEFAWVQDGRSSIRIFRHLWKGLIKGSEHGSRRVHPTQKPIALSEWCINKYEPESVLDLFGGSGSTLIACEKTNRKCFMMELDPHYCDVIVARWEKYTGKKAELLNG
jgi:DNA modification methylase